MSRARIWAAAAVIAVACIAMPAAWAHGPDEMGGFTSEPPNIDQRNAALLPKSLPPQDRGPANAVLDQMYMWETGAHLDVCFVDPAPAELKDRIIKAARQWMYFANVFFDFDLSCAANKSYDISIGFRPGGGRDSYIGTESRDHDPSMNLEGLDNPKSRIAGEPREFDRVVLHEFGHAIGLDHEHQSPDAHCADQIDWKKADAYYGDPAHGGWTPQQVMDNLQTIVVEPGARAQKDELKISGFDPKSIMMYSLPPEIFKIPQSPCITATNYVLSSTDKKWVAGVYPADAADQAKIKQAALSLLDEKFKQAGVPDTERKTAIDNIGKTFGLTIEQINQAGHDIINTTTQQNSTGAGASNQSSSGAGAINQSNTGSGTLVNQSSTGAGAVNVGVQNGSGPAAVNLGTNNGTVVIGTPPARQ